MKKTVLSVLTTLPLMFGLVCLNPAFINAQEEVELPFVSETEELPPRSFMPVNPPAIEVQEDLDAQNYEWKEEKEFFFNVKNEDGSIDEKL
ncbi:MAG: hypothetical protein KBT48_11725 [Firmicutes bacterium]|nr:hypothetical protein [Bacillota bacterium]